MASYGKRGKYWYAYWRDPEGKSHAKSFKQDREAAKAYAAEKDLEIVNGTYKVDSDITFTDFAEQWLNYYAKPNMQKSSLDTAILHVNSHFIPFFGEGRLADITLYDLEQYVALKIAQGLEVTTAHRHITTLKTIFKYAKKWDFIKVNPAAELRRPKARKKEMNFLSPAEIPQLLEHVHPNYFPVIFMAIFTGMRISELLAVTWADVNFEESYVSVNKQFYKGKFTILKTDAANRRIFMSPALAQVLLDYKDQCPKNDADLVFPAESGNPKERSRIGKRGLTPAVRNAGINKHIRVHDLRHTFAALLISQKEPLEFVRQQMGHSSIRVTIDKYGHLIPEDYEGIGDRFDKRILGDDVNNAVNRIKEAAKINLKLRLGRHHIKKKDQLKAGL